MAKSKISAEEEKLDNRSELEKIITKKYGAILFSGSHIEQNPKRLIKTTASLDISLGGGIPEGGVYLISGAPKTGKTTLAMQIAANAQKEGRHIYFLDAEHRFTTKNLSTVAHFQTTPDLFTLVSSTREKILCSQDFLNMAGDIASNHPDCFIILDSISCLCSSNEMNKEVGEAARPEGPKMFGQFCRKNAGVIPINNITILGILHRIANTSGYGAATMEDGGNKIQYAMNGKFVCKGSQAWLEGTGESEKRVGQIVTWQIAEQANGPPGDVVTSYLRYGYGYDNAWEIICLALDFGLIGKAGSWFSYLPDESNPESLVKKQGQSQLYEYFKGHPDQLESLYSKVKELALC